MALLLFVSAMIQIILCEPSIWKSERQNIGSTTFRSFIEFSEDNIDKIGVYFDKTGLVDLVTEFPDNPSANQLYNIVQRDNPSEIELYCCGEERTFDFPDIFENDLQKFNHLVVNYNPEGQIPFDAYGVPHFDFNFYFNDEAERKQFGTKYQDERCQINDLLSEVTCPQLEICEKPIEDKIDFFPGGDSGRWVCSACSSSKGSRCADTITATELFGGDEFDHTLLMSSADGRITSTEPMITVESFKTLLTDNRKHYRSINKGTFKQYNDELSLNELCTPFQTPNRYAFGEGFYPTTYCFGCARQHPLYGENKCYVYLTDYEFKY